MNKLILLTLCLATLPSTAVLAAPQDVRVIATNNPQQPFEMAAKLQWNPHSRQWDKVLVLYNGNPEPPASHPAWAYLNSLKAPANPPAQEGENLHYQAFHLNAYCSGATPLASGKPIRISFDHDQPGSYREQDYFRDWNCPDWSMGLDNVTVVSGAEARNSQGGSLRIRLPKGASGCNDEKTCANWKPQIGAQLDSLHYAYWFKFPANFDFVQGGKLPGIGSFNPRTGGGKPDGRDGWSVRAMWVQGGKAGQYVYHMDQPGNYGDFFAWDAPPLATGQWHQVKTFVRLNTPGKRDGIITTWLDGKEVLHKDGLRFRLGNGLKIERFLFSVFFGGEGPEWAPERDMLLYLDDFTLSANRM
ncbi:hypothetical protein VSS37_13820 [Candidatus Thiothrix sp. Deng01]|uniref:Polysaccharide lyase 14 domain-containing protein n=1 Tax=Candidatus Thiothrix phosphatis TaxID=3112415 RepID=A0ABU6CZ08_9GAMM|nr:hypothetical protein [Candidatus Thiothrix sp. Deng01]MEB4592066.1 hypothetical protein [Candidatus Thiothrix sp. Deng01]